MRCKEKCHSERSEESQDLKSRDLSLITRDDREMRAFTLIELLLIVAIMLTLSIMAPTFYSRFLGQNAVANTVDQLTGSLRKAQTYSMMSKQGSAWSVNYSSNTITLYKGTVFASRDQSFDEKFTVNSNVTVSGITDVSFNRMTGVPSLAPTVTISSGNNSKQVTINSQGVVSK